MTLGRFLLGLPLATGAFAPLVAGAVSLRRRFLPDWTRPLSILVDVVLVLAGLTIVGETLGTFGWLSLWALIAAGSGCGAAMILSARSRRPMSSDTLPTLGPEPIGRTGWILIGAGIFLTAGAWLARTLAALSHGIGSIDSNWYHLPIALRFTQSGHVNSVQVLDPDSVTAYFPATSSLYHAMGMLLFRSDLLSVGLNLGWLALALLAAWCIGRTFGVAPAAMGAAAIVLAGPGMVDTQPGGALTDVVGIALFLAMIAVALHPTGRDRPVAQDVIAGLAGGLATGMKFTFLIPVIACALAIGLAAPRAQRLRRTVFLAVGGAATGIYWYGRNIALTGNPLPALDATLGPLHLSAIEGSVPGTSVSSLLFDRQAWTQHLLPGLRDAYGPVWIPILAVAAIGIVGAIVSGPCRLIRLLGVAALVSTVGFIFSPQYLYGGRFFATNLRYAAPGLILGLALAPIVARRFPQWVAAAIGAILILTQFDPTSWPIHFGGPSFFAPVHRTDSAAALAILTVCVLALLPVVIVWRGNPTGQWRPSTPIILLSVAVVAVVAILASVHGRYYDHRYQNSPPYPAAYRWAQGLHHENIGLSGIFLALKYPFAGRDLSNRVTYLAVSTPDGGFRPAASCDEWIDLLHQQKLTYVLILVPPDDRRGQAAWTAEQPGTDLVKVFRVAEGKLELLAYRLSPRSGRPVCAS